MYELNDTIVAVSSPAAGQRAIVRITGPDTIDICEKIFTRSIPKERSALIAGSIAIGHELKIDAKLYLFLSPYSYTGDDVAEIHIHTNASVTEALVRDLLGGGLGAPLRMAGPGEFTARAYLNGKIDLAQAEAVNEIVVSSNKFQLDAAEKLLSGRLAETTGKVRSAMMDCLSLIEAGLDFSGEDIEFITRSEAVRALAEIKAELEQLLSASISYESVIDLPAVGIAGAPNAGKSSLLNKLLGKARSIVSHRRRTTRDVLTGLLTLAHCRCVLFDCAGLTGNPPVPNNVLDELAQQAAVEALRNASVVIFCIDASKADWAEDIAIRRLIEPEVLIAVATKSDLLCEDELAEDLSELNELFSADFIVTSAKDGTGIELLREAIDRKIIEQAFRCSPSIEHRLSSIENRVALTARHRQALTLAIENVSESINELKAGSDEVTAMMLRAAYQAVADIDSAGRIDDEILEKIFSRFCIGK
ncbi:MAG: tRNA modification GTPase [Planctomycetota bacterium]|jgi:tRNA modification GTPase